MAAVEKLKSIFSHTDIFMAIGLVIVVGMMVLPLPPSLLDFLLVINISISVIIMLACLYTKEPLDYSSFPVVLLISTIFRLALNVSSTRLILLHADAGKIITAFGQFVVGGNYIVGFIIFAVLVIINFMVITGGAGRVAEVSARFTLDSLPGKQLSIDADLNAGLIDEHQAKQRRRKVEREADFYGTMDGASKFVKGDATASIVITVINIIGGIIIGVWQLKTDIMTALSTYTILTVGDGLVSQIPALLISFATGLIISRASGQDSSLSDDIKTEMFSNPKVLGVVAGLLGFIGIVPGMPTIPFICIALSVGGLSFLRYKEKIKKEKAEKEIATSKKAEEKVAQRKQKATKESVMELLNVEAIEVEIGYRLVPLLDPERGGDLLERISQIRKQTALELGIVLPSIRVRDNLQLSPNAYQIKIKGVPVESSEVFPNKYLAMNTLGETDDTLKGVQTTEPAFGLPSVWIAESDKDDAEMRGYTVVPPSAVISTHLTEIIKKNAADILSRADISQLIDNLKKEVSDDYVNDLMKDTTVAEVQQVIKNLLSERVSVRDLKTILEVITFNSKTNHNTDFLTEKVREGLARSICKQNSTDEGDLFAVVLAPETENVIFQGRAADGVSIALEPETSIRIQNKINSELEKAILKSGSQPVIICSSPIRLALRKWLERKYPHISIMSYNEISNNVKVKSVGQV